MSGKGGVGKSTVAAQLAVGLAARGKLVGPAGRGTCMALHPPHAGGCRAMPKSWKSNKLIAPVVVEDGLKVISVELLLPNKETSIIWRGPMKIGVIKQLMGDVEWGGLDYLIHRRPSGHRRRAPDRGPGGWTTPRQCW